MNLQFSKLVLFTTGSEHYPITTQHKMARKTARARSSRRTASKDIDANRTEEMVKNEDVEEDDEYRGEEEEEEEEEDEVEEEEVDNDDDDDEDEDERVTSRRTSRKRKAAALKDEEGNSEDEEDQGTENQPEQEQEDDDDEEEEDEEDDEEEGGAGDEGGEDGADAETEDSKSKAKQERKVPKKRGRKKLRITVLEDGAFDEEGNPLNIRDEEVVIENEDPKGLEKVDELGHLKGGRRYRVKTFTLLNHGDKQFMISTEPARLVGFRDSYLLFKTHRSLFKKVCDNEEKMDLIDRHIIPNSYKGRSVNLVSARSIFREFGAKIIYDGKKVIDDFWEQRAIDNGDIPGTYADPTEIRHVAPTVSEPPSGSGNTPVSAATLFNYQGDPTWMYLIAAQTREYNTKLLEQRSLVVIRGQKDTYTGLTFFPLSTQPTKSKLIKVEDAKETLYDTYVTNPNILRKYTGLSTVPKHILEEIDDPVLLKEIKKQQDYELLLMKL